MERFIFDNDQRGIRIFKHLSLETRQKAVELFNVKHKRRILNDTAGEFERACDLLSGDELIVSLTVGNDIYAALKCCLDHQTWVPDSGKTRSQRERYGIEVFTLNYLGCVFDVATMAKFRAVLQTPEFAELIQRDLQSGVQILPRTDLT